jgi:hypothetical protein
LGLDEIWSKESNWLTEKSKVKDGFKARSTGCGCCSTELETEEEVKKEAIDSLSMIIRAQRFFKWNMNELLKLGEEKMKNLPKNWKTQ